MMKPIYKKIAVVIISAGIYYFLDRFTGIKTAFEGIRITYSCPFLALVSVIYGPIVGGAAGLIGQIVLETGKLIPDWIAVVCSALNFASIGFFCRKIDIHNGFFSRRDVGLFVRVEILSNYVSFMLLSPALSALILKSDFRSVLRTGFWVALNNAGACLLITTLLLDCYAKSRLTAANFYRN